MGIEKRRSTLSVLFYIKRQKLLKNGEAPVCMRITVDKRKAEIMIKRSVPVELWNQSKECSKGKDRNSQELNHYISSVRAKVLQIHRELEVDAKWLRQMPSVTDITVGIKCSIRFWKSIQTITRNAGL